MIVLVGVICGVIGVMVGGFAVIVKIADIMDEHKED